ncbi:hypothetical protein Tco_0779263 [Tanacetum coccineum]
MQCRLNKTFTLLVSKTALLCLIKRTMFYGLLVKADDQAIQTILLGLPKDIYAAVDSCETAQEIWLRVQQMMKGFDIGIQEKKAKLFNDWEMFTSTDGESIESYYHRFSKLMNDFKRNKHFPEKIASNLKFLNNLQPKWSRHVTIVNQTKDLHTADYNQLYDFLKYNQKEVDDLRAERLAKTHDPLALMANSNNPYNYLVFHPDQPSPNTYIITFNQNYMQQPMSNLEDITDPTTAMNMIAQSGMNVGQDRHMQMVGGCSECSSKFGHSENGLIVVTEIANLNPNGNNGIQLQAEEFNFMAAIGDLEEIKEVNAKCILMANLQQALTSDTSNLQTELERTKEQFENCIIKKENEYAKLWNDWYKKCKECKYDKILYDKAHNDMQQQIEQLQAQLGDLKGKSKDTTCASDTLDPLSQKLENENVLQKADKSNDSSKPVTSNSVPITKKSKVVKNDNVIAPGMFRIDSCKTSRIDNFVPNKHVKASIRTKLITVSQSHVITKKDVNPNTNAFSPKNVESTTRTRRPQHRNNPKNDKVPSRLSKGVGYSANSIAF